MSGRRRFFIPEVVQTSAMDCGPAALACLLGGFGIRASYGRLREACQTDLDGTSIDALEDAVGRLGLDAQQVMVPVEHVLLPEAGALPAIVVVRLAAGLAHFVVAWRRHGRIVQLMDPARGRRWIAARSFEKDVYVHEMPVPAGDWREWAGTDAFTAPLKRRLTDLGLPAREAGDLVSEAGRDTSWRGLGQLDARVRLAASLVASGSVRPGRECGRIVRSATPPGGLWSVRETDPDEDGSERVLLRGAVLLSVQGTSDVRARPEDMSDDLAAALTEPDPRPVRELLSLLGKDGVLSPLTLAAGAVLGAGAVVVQALLLRGLLDVGRDLGTTVERVGAVGALVGFLVALLLVELPAALGWRRLGRGLETRLRASFLRKIPLLPDRYFASRLQSDMASRGHELHRVRDLPELGGHVVRLAAQLVVTTAGLIWLAPDSAPLALVAAALALGLPVLAQPFLAERDLRVKNHRGALSRFDLDALLGLVPIRTHGGERSMRLAQEHLLVDWARAALSLVRVEVVVEAAIFGSGFACAALLLLHHASGGVEAASALLVAYWALELPRLGEEIGQVAQQLPGMRNVTLRVLEPLGAKEAGGAADCGPAQPASRPASIRLDSVGVVAGGHRILEDVDLAIQPGEHVAMVGTSGAGKSSLLGLLLGWHEAARGRVLVDGEALTGGRLARLRRETAWVDPAVQLWNRSLLENLRYGTDRARELTQALETADLSGVLERMPDGLQSVLGESGALVSGGEGQRVRLARALLREGVRLVLLDEPFRGLDRERRAALLAAAREHWKDQTLVCVTHDVGETLEFPRVLVVDAGRLVEDDAPAVLAGRADSRYARLLAAEREVREGSWGGPGWRRLRLARGRLTETQA